jgi:D-alanine-D-alanine ligase
MDAEGRIFFIEANPLPGLAPGWSDLVLIAKAAGIEYRQLIGEILSFAIRRHQERERERGRARRAQLQAGRESQATATQRDGQAAADTPVPADERQAPPAAGEEGVAVPAERQGGAA